MGDDETAAENFWSLYLRTIASCVLVTAALTAVISSGYILIIGMMEDGRPEPIGDVIVGLIVFSRGALSLALILAIPIILLSAVIWVPIWALALLWMHRQDCPPRMAAPIAAAASMLLGWLGLLLILSRAFYYDSLIDAGLSVYGVSSLLVGIVVSPFLASAIFSGRKNAEELPPE